MPLIPAVSGLINDEKSGERMRRWLKYPIQDIKIQFVIFGWIFIVLTILFTWTSLGYNDYFMRRELIKKSQILVSMLNIEQLRRLEGTEADLLSSDYAAVKDQLAQAIQFIPKARFLYLTGRRSDGLIFFYVDSEPPGSEDESPPGQIYDEASEDFHRVFLKGRSIVEGPFQDRWGTWVSALLPVVDPLTGRVMAVFGMDIAAHDWHWDAASRAAIPSALFSIVLIIIFSLVFHKQQINVQPKPVFRRLLWPLLLIIGAIVVGFVMLLWWQQNFLLTKNIEYTVRAVPRKFSQALKIQSDGIARAAGTFADGLSLKEKFTSGNQEQIVSLHQPLLRDLHRYFRVSHFYVVDADQQCLAAFYYDGKSGVTVDCPFLPMEEKTAFSGTGLGLTPSGKIALIVVQPYFSDSGDRLGSVIFSRDIHDALDDLVEPGVDVTAVVRKARFPGRIVDDIAGRHDDEIDWDQFPNDAVIYSSIKNLPQKLNRFFEAHIHHSTTQEIKTDDKIWRVSLIPFVDFWGKPLGDLVIFYDISVQKAAGRHLVFVFGGVLSVLLAILFSFLFIILRRTDQGILTGERKLRESEQELRSLFERMISAFALFESVFDDAGNFISYRFIYVNKAYEEITGVKAVDVKGKTIHEVWPETEDDWVKAYGRVVMTGVSSTFEMYHAPTKHWYYCNVYRADESSSRFCVIFNVVTELKEAEERLRKTNLFLDAVIENIPDMIFVKDARELRFIRFNKAGLDLLGSALDDLIGKNDYDFFPPEQAKFFIQKDRQVLNEKITVDIPEEPIETRANGRRILHTKKVPILDSNGDPEYLLGISEDITERKQAQDLILKRLSYEKLLSCISAMAVVVNDLASFQESSVAAMGEIMGVSRVYLFEHRYDTETMDNTHEWCNAGISSQKSSLQGVPASISRWWVETLTNGRTIAFPDIEDMPDDNVKNMLRPQGVLSILVVPLFVKGQYFGFIGFDDCRQHRQWPRDDVELLLAISRIISGVIERKQAEEALRQSEARFQSVVSNVPGVIFRCRNDEHRSMEFLSQRIEELTGYPAGEFLSQTRSYHSIRHPDDAEEVAAKIQEALVQRRAYSLEYRICAAGGQIKWVQESGRGLFHANGDLLYIDGVIEDITQQKKYDDEMRYLEDQLAQSKKMAAIGKLSAGVAHEIKNPLAVILLSADALKHAVDLDESNHKLLEMIRHSAERANKIVADLLNFSRHSKLSLREVKPEEIVRTAAANIRGRLAGQPSVVLEEVNAVADDIVVDVDPVLMEHVLLNILSNAVDALPSGGKILLSTGLQFPSNKIKNHVVIKVKDNGSGISADIIDRIFEPFVTTKEVGKGTGLGLSLAYSIVERHGGTILAESVPGEGSVFTIILPCRRLSSS